MSKPSIKPLPLWYKGGVILLLVYVLGTGLLLPLGNGLKSVSPVVLPQGQEVEIEVQAHNVRYTDTTTRARIRLNDAQAICAQRSLWDEEKGLLRLYFDLPVGQLPIDQSSRGRSQKSPFPMLELYSSAQGYSSLETAFFFKPDSTVSEAAPTTALCATESWTSGSSRLQFPFLNILEETIRNLYFHVPMWFGMMFILLASVVFSVRVLRNPTQEQFDQKANAYALVGVVFGVLGVVTGAIWAKNTWGSYWSWDVKQNTSAVALLIYLAYFVLRGALDDADKRAKVSAIYNIFAFATLIPLLYVVPRLTDSLHPGMGGNPAFSSYDLDSSMRLVFYPAILAWTGLGFWLANLWARMLALEDKILSAEAL